MKRILKISVSLVVAVIILVSAFSFNISAASATTHFSPNKTDFAIGEQMEVTIKFDAGVNVVSIDGALSYNNAVMQYVSGGSSNQGSSVRIVESFDPQTQVTISVKFKAIAEGQCSFSFSGFCTDETLTPHSATTGYYVNVTAPAPTPPPTPTPTPDPTPTPTPTPSTNANLASLRVSGATLSPTFSAAQTSYTATVDNSVTKVSVSANVADGGATFTGAGTFDLAVGDNEQYITVTAADGKTKKTYKLVIKRLAEGENPQDTDEIPGNDPLLVTTTDGSMRKIMQDISALPVPYGFELTSVMQGEVSVGAYKEIDGSEYTLYYLTDIDGANHALYYKNSLGKFERLVYIEVNSKMYIIEEPKGNYSIPSGWYEDIVRLGDTDIKAFKSENSKLAEFYMICCYVDGQRGFYRFDSLESTLQRAPDFKLGTIENVNTNNSTKLGLFKRFANMDTAGKVVIIFLVIAIICIITLVALMIIKIIKSSNYEEDDDFSFAAEETDYEADASQEDFDLYSSSREE